MRDSSGEINIAFIMDDRYAAIAGTAITSLKVNRRADSRYHIYLIVIEVTLENLERFKQLEDEGFAVTIVVPDEKYTQLKLNIGGYNSITDYTRLYIAEILTQLDKVIYLDDDLIIRHDLTELYEVNIEEYYCAASRDMLGEINSPSLLERLQSSLPYYFNAGVMVLNLKKMREDNITEQLIDYVLHGNNFVGNQDAFNIVFDGKVKYISCEWNLPFSYLKRRSTKEIAEYYGLDSSIGTESQLLDGTHILHFTGTARPWETYQFYFTDLYLSYFKKSPFGCGEIFQPYNHKKSKDVLFLFPYESVEKGSRVVLYGAGLVGEDYFVQIQKTGYCRLISWTDSGWKNMEGYDYEGTTYQISEPRETLGKGKQYDACIVAIQKEEIYREIKEQLLEIGVPEKKIIWKKPQFIPLFQ